MMDIVYTCQENYAQYAGVSIYSLLKANINEIIKIHFLDSGLSKKSKEIFSAMCQKHGNASIVFYNVADLLTKHSSKLVAFQNNYATYAKLFLELLLPKDVKGCLYIDADTMVLGNVRKVFEEKTDKTLKMNYDIAYKSHKKELGLSENAAYYNAGVIFINLAQWRDKKYSDKILDCISKQTNFKWGDQDIFNILFKNDIELLGFSYNVLSQFYFYRTSELCKLCFDLNDSIFFNESDFYINSPCIVHFTYMPFILRPWFKGSNHPLVKTYKNIVLESPYSESFIYKKCKQPLRRKIIQFIGRKRFPVWFVRLIGAYWRKKNEE